MHRTTASALPALNYDAVSDPAREDDELNPYFYRFGRTRRQAVGKLQHALGTLPLRALVGVGAVHTTIDDIPKDSGTTFLAAELAGRPLPGGYSSFVRAGLGYLY
jgi:hypothetical protein